MGPLFLTSDDSAAHCAQLNVLGGHVRKQSNCYEVHMRKLLNDLIDYILF